MLGMVTIRFAKDGDTLAKSLDQLLVFATASMLSTDEGRAALPEAHAERILQLLEGCEAGPTRASRRDAR
jgi:hypothetical protein